jgi:chloramphenicol-sensitive protein RarD
VGVLYLTLTYGRVPWISLILAVSFSIYALIRKTAALGSLQGQALESLVLAAPGAAFLLWSSVQPGSAISSAGAGEVALLLGAGVVTAFPLLMFSSAARLLDFSTLGVVQYLSPTLQFLLGVLAYGEPFTLDRLIGFALIWSALVIYTLEGLSVRKSQVGYANGRPVGIRRSGGEAK